MANLTAIPAAEIFSPTAIKGEVVNVHVVEYVHEPQPDFEAMQRLIAGGTKASPMEPTRRDNANREISEKR
jgi:hypothetical protein